MALELQQHLAAVAVGRVQQAAVAVGPVQQAAVAVRRVQQAVDELGGQGWPRRTMPAGGYCRRIHVKSLHTRVDP